MDKGEAMSRWGYSPLENIAFALQKIAVTLEKMENKMPVPQGDITTSDLFTTPEVEVEEEVEDDLPSVS